MKQNIRIMDADNHYYEPDDAFTRYIGPKFKHKAINIRRAKGTIGRPYFGDEPLSYINRTPTDLVGKPGAHAENERRYDALKDEDMVRPGEIPWFVDRDARLTWMDGEGVDSILLWPGIGLVVERQMRSDPAACVANLQAFNRWLDDAWGFDYEGRIKGVPWLTLIDLDAAIEELERVVELGAQVIALLFAPVNGKSLGDPYFDPFWSRVAESGVAVGFHGADSGYTELLSAHWGEDPRPLAEEQSPFQLAMFYNQRAIMDTLASLILHNLFGRHPNLQVMSIENGSAWVPFLLESIDRGFREGRGGKWLGGQFDKLPSEIFKEHISVAPFDDDDIEALIQQIGADAILLGSDYPHPEGLAGPRRFLEGVNCSEADAHKISHENLERILNFAG